MLENDQAITCEMLVEGYTVADATKEIGERSLAVLERPPPQVLASSSIRSKPQCTASVRRRQSPRRRLRMSSVGPTGEPLRPIG